MSPITGPQMPAQQTTVLVATSPRVVLTPVTRPRTTSNPVTSVFDKTCSAPIASAWATISAAASTARVTRPALGVHIAPLIGLMSRKGNSSFASLGAIISAWMPHVLPDATLRCSSRIRSAVRAISIPPTVAKQGLPLCWSEEKKSSPYFEKFAVTSEWSTGKEKLEACCVEPPGSGHLSCSRSRMSLTPRLAR